MIASTSMVSIIEGILEQLTQFVICHSGKCLLATLFSLALLLSGMTFLYTDVTNESLFKADDPALLDYQRFQAQFGRDDAVVAAIHSPDIFTPEFFSKLDAYQKDLEASVPYLDLVTSLVSVTAIADQDGDLQIGDLVDQWPDKPEDYETFKESVISNPLYRNIIISNSGDETLVVIQASAFANTNSVPPNFKTTILDFHDRFRAYMEASATGNGKPVVKPPTRAQGNELDLSELPFDIANALEQASESNELEAVKPLTTYQMEMFVLAAKEVTQRHQSKGFDIRLAGGQMIDYEHKESIHADFLGLMPIIFLLVFIILYIVLGRLDMVFLPMCVVVLSLLSTFGLMGWMGAPITPVAVALPPLILTVGVGDSMHLLSLYLGQINKTEDRRQAIIYAVRRSGVAILFTTLTTAAGFLAFTIADIRSIASFGLFAAFGVIMALLLTLILIPAILCLKKDFKAGVHSTFSERWHILVKWLTGLTNLSMEHSNKAIAFIVLTLALCIPGIMKIQFSHDVLTWFADDNPLRVNVMAIDEVFEGIVPLEIIVDTGKANGIYSPQFMARLDEFQAYAESFQLGPVSTSRATSIVDTLKRIHSEINKGNPESPLSNNTNLIAQELLLFEGSGADDVEKLIDSEFSMVRITVRLSWADALHSLPAGKRLTNKAQQIFRGEATITSTGTTALISQALVGVIQSMSTSYLIAGTAITLMMLVLLRSLPLTLISMIPNVLPILCTLALMGYTGIPITLFTVLLGGIALGLVVDDTVHFMHGYCHYREQGFALEESINLAITQTGPALLFTTFSIATGFMIFTLSTNIALYYLGILLGITVIGALAADIMLVPALLKKLEQFTPAPVRNQDAY
ncbi:MAG: MMPL family transporter [Pseudomonadales bacterium]